jgi:hypothetical protein
MPDTETYTVTKRAGPRVAGRPAKAGDELQLTELQARSEVLSGALVKGSKADAKAKDGKDAFAGSEELRHIQARARGLDKAPEPAAEQTETKASGKATSDGASKPSPAPAAGGQGSAGGSAGAGS